jgi:hypothetical protein
VPSRRGLFRDGDVIAGERQFRHSRNFLRLLGHVIGNKRQAIQPIQFFAEYIGCEQVPRLQLLAK